MPPPSPKPARTGADPAKARRAKAGRAKAGRAETDHAGTEPMPSGDSPRAQGEPAPEGLHGAPADASTSRKGAAQGPVGARGKSGAHNTSGPHDAPGTRKARKAPPAPEAASGPSAAAGPEEAAAPDPSAHRAEPPDAPRARRRDTRGTAARIRQAARQLFLAKGYGATSMDAVAAAAPVSKRTLYQHFPSKVELFGAVVEESWSRFTRAPALPTNGAGDPRTVLAAYVARLMAHWDQPDVVPLLRLIIAEAPRFPEMSAAYFKAGKEPAVQGLAAYFALLAAEGKLAPGADPQLAAAQFMGAIKEPLFWPRVLGVPSAFSPQVAVERAIAAVLRQEE